MNIKLNFVDFSNDPSNSDIVIIQKNQAPGFDTLAVAWRVIRNCGRGNHHPFQFPLSLEVNAEDQWGNHNPRLKAAPGALFAMKLNPSGHELVTAGTAGNPEEVQVRNDLERGAVTVNLYRDGRLVATKDDVAPGQLAAFKLKPIIYIGVASQVEEGANLNSAVISAINTEISLEGIIQADIVMTGGGAGPDAKPFEFRLENTVKA